MKRVRQFLVAVLLFAVSSIPTSSFGLSYDLQLEFIYYEGATVVGRTTYNSCFGHFDSTWGKQSGTHLLKRYTDCDDGTTQCYWYSWNGSEWTLVAGPSCTPPRGFTRPPRYAI